MGLFDLFTSGRKKASSAQSAKDRLSLILMQERSDRSAPDYLPAMQKELLEVISKYININPEDISVEVNKDGNIDLIQLKVELPDHH
ncbi:cell division topological specificity factor MinE [Basilea psittacipulmonis]|uniref:Cell division topological specificity factor n=1 Tax=Basilea psittacipulmonis DSM 24701 TaxID=1072685 RepID=A0A077DBG2_9BURK|nr:cell division topological specificity factor MinE [Basilea psittacipulmonis]AIL32185.1 hypothetical protein IX83_01630 [Basilea psittacipulmonis DSM 24701]